MNTAKLTAKNQATVPKEVRQALHLHPGDTLLYEVLADETVVLKKATPLDIEYLRALESTLSEWGSKEDDEAYRNL